MATTDYLPLLNKGLRENYDLAASDYPLMAKDLFHVMPSKSRYEMEQTWGGYQLPQPRLDGTSIQSGTTKSIPTSTMDCRTFFQTKRLTMMSME
jgi:hypothetical protein